MPPTFYIAISRCTGLGTHYHGGKDMPMVGICLLSVSKAPMLPRDIMPRTSTFRACSVSHASCLLTPDIQKRASKHPPTVFSQQTARASVPFKKIQLCAYHPPLRPSSPPHPSPNLTALKQDVCHIPVGAAVRPHNTAASPSLPGPWEPARRLFLFFSNQPRRKVSTRSNGVRSDGCFSRRQRC